MNFSEFVEHAIRSGDDLRMTRHRPLAGKVYAITGKLAEGVTRRDFDTLMRMWGAHVENVVDYRTIALLAVDPERGTAKRRDATRYGTPVLREADFVKHVLLPASAVAARADGRVAAVDVDDTAILDRIKPLTNLGA